jgi:hypothetical protein
MQNQKHYHYAYYRSTFTNFKGYESEISDSTICIKEIFPDDSYKKNVRSYFNRHNDFHAVFPFYSTNVAWNKFKLVNKSSRGIF